MSEGAQGSERPFFGKHWEGFKDFWGERFLFLNNYSRFLDPENPLPHWDSSDVEKFISADRKYGPTLSVMTPNKVVAGETVEKEEGSDSEGLGQKSGSVVRDVAVGWSVSKDRPKKARGGHVWAGLERDGLG